MDGLIFDNWREISIHALREEGDTDRQIHKTLCNISIHALREEGDVCVKVNVRIHGLFQSTPSARRATLCNGFIPPIRQISIHALREEGDASPLILVLAISNFNPRPPRGGRLFLSMMASHVREISIHALREEGDDSDPGSERRTSYFNPRPPRGGRPALIGGNLTTSEFQSTPSARRATTILILYTDRCCISIHALREEGDLPSAPMIVRFRFNFNPRPPRGGRPAVDGDRPRDVSISIHALREEGDGSRGDG